MAELAIAGGAPVRPGGYPQWPQHDERDVEAVARVVRERCTAPSCGTSPILVTPVVWA